MPHWFLRARARDLFLMLVGLIGLISSFYLIGGQPGRTKARKDLAFQQEAIKREEERRKAELVRQQAVREQQLREAEAERRRQEERRKQEAEARRKLEQEGVRVADISAPELPPSVGVGLVIRSEPDHAEVFLDWERKGQTPLRLEGITITGLLVVAKDGHQAWFQEGTYAESRALSIHLPAVAPRPRTRFLLLRADAVSEAAFISLRTHLAEEGFAVLGPAEAEAFQRALRKAGGLSHPGFRAWARTKFDTDMLVMARIDQRDRELGAQSNVLAGAVRTSVTIELEVHDLTSGHHLAALSSYGTAFASDRQQSLQQALTQAAIDAAKKLRAWFQG